MNSFSEVLQSLTEGLGSSIWLFFLCLSHFCHHPCQRKSKHKNLLHKRDHLIKNHRDRSLLCHSFGLFVFLYLPQEKPLHSCRVIQEFAGSGTCYLFALFQLCLLSSHVNGFFSSFLSSVLNGCSLPMYYYPPVMSSFNKQSITTCFTKRNGTKTVQMRLYPEILLKAPG